MSNEITIWKPSEFDGTDLLPLEAGVAQQVDGPSSVPLVGRENIGAEDIILPSIRILQGMSPAVARADVEGAQPGMFMHSLTNELWEAPLRAIAIVHTKSNALYVRDNDPRFNGIKQCLSRDGIKGTTYGLCSECLKCTEWIDNKPPLGSQAHNFVLLTAAGPMVLRMSRTSFKSARAFVTSWKMSRKNLWAHPVVLTTTRNDKRLPSGQTATYFTVELRWQTKERIPDNIQVAAYELSKQITKAHEEGRFGSDEETAEEHGF